MSTQVLFPEKLSPVPYIKGLLIVGVLSALSMFLAQFAWCQQWGISALTLAVVVGIVAGNTVLRQLDAKSALGVDFAKNKLLRLGIILYGFRITFGALSEVGLAGVMIDVVMLSSTFIITYLLGTRWLKMDKQSVVLIGAGSSICGAAAVMATEGVIKAQAHKVSVAVATVVVFGTIAMFLYPFLMELLQLTEHQYGIYVGSTVHEVAQVVAAGNAVSEAAGNTAVIEKMLRVMMLAPFLVIIGEWFAKSSKQHSEVKSSFASKVPWFAVAFIAVAIINSLVALPKPVTHTLVELDNLVLCMAMVALGLNTRVEAIKQAGVKPLLLAGIMFAYLIGAGAMLNHWMLG